MNMTVSETEQTSRCPALSFRAMQREALRLINSGCIHRGFRGCRELSLRAGVPEAKAQLVYFEDGQLPNDIGATILNLNGKEWDGLLSATEVPLEVWVENSRQNTPPNVEPDDLVESLATAQYGAAASGEAPDLETQQHITNLLGYSTAFYLKASGVRLPSHQ